MSRINKRRTHRERGWSFTEVVVTTAVSGVLLLVGVPVVDDARRAAALSRAAQQVQGLLLRCRAVAMLRGKNCSVVFNRELGGRWRCFVAEDGDGDGVRRVDIHAGIDPIVGRVVTIDGAVAGPSILPEPVPDPSGRGRLGGDLGDPIRAGRGDMISFSARGTATPSSVYFSDHTRRMIVLRVYGGTARVNRLQWRSGLSHWQPG